MAFIFLSGTGPLDLILSWAPLNLQADLQPPVQYDMLALSTQLAVSDGDSRAIV